jgi:tetratricopeptide (TPR) repeat protein
VTWLRACLASQQHDVQLALALCRKILRGAARDEFAREALLLAARIEADLGDYDQAAENYQRWLCEHPDHPQTDMVLYQWAWSLEDARRSHEAERVFQEIHELHTHSSYWADATYRLAERAHQQGRVSGSRALLESLLTTAAPISVEVAAHAWSLKARLHADQRDWNSVLEAV